MLSNLKGFKVVPVLLILGLALALFAGTALAGDEVEDYEVQITRLSGEDRYGTAVEIADYAYDGEADTVVIARADELYDALSGSVLAAALEAPVLLTETDALHAETASAIDDFGATEAVILGGTAAVSEAVETELEDMDLEVSRYYGGCRYETAADIAEEAAALWGDDFPQEAFIVSGETEADALTIGPYAAEKGMPILLVREDEVPGATSDVIDELGIEKLTVIGGDKVVSEKVKQDLEAEQRISGADRYKTSAEVAEEFYPPDGEVLDPENVIFARGHDNHLVDAMAGGYFGAMKEAPILYTSSLDDSIEDYFLSINFEGLQAYILGGTDALSEDTEAEIEGIMEDPIELDEDPLEPPDDPVTPTPPTPDPDPEVVSVEDINDRNVEYERAFDDLGLPGDVVATLDDESTTTVDVEWDEDDYDGNEADTYELEGELVELPDGVNNTDNVMAEVSVEVREEGKNVLNEDYEVSKEVIGLIEEDGTDGPEGKWYEDISTAIDEASEGDTLVAYPMTYDENVEIDVKNLTLESYEKYGAILEGGQEGEDRKIDISADKVTLDGFKVTDAFHGIRINGEDAVVQNNKIQDIARWSLTINEDHAFVKDNVIKNQGSWGTERQPRGMFFYHGEHATLRGNEMINAGLSTSQHDHSVLETHDVDESNVIEGKSIVYLVDEQDEIITEAGIVWLVGCENITVDGVEIHSVETAVLMVGGSGNTVMNSVIGGGEAELHRDGYNIGWRGIIAIDSEDNTIQDNEVLNARGGIEVRTNSHNNVITGNLITESRQASVIRASDNTEFKDNTIKDSGWLDTDTEDTGLLHWAGSTGTVLEDNVFEDNSPQVRLWDGNLELHQVLKDNTFEPTSVVTTVDGEAAIDIFGETEYNVLNIDKGKGYMEIQAAIDEADPNDTIEVAAGTYDETPSLDKPLTLRSVDKHKAVVKSFGRLDADASGSTIDGFTLTDGGSDGIYLNDSDGVNDVTIINNHFSNITGGNEAISTDGGVINDGEFYSNLHIEGNTIEDIKGTVAAIFLQTISNSTVKDNYIDGSNDPDEPDHNSRGIQIDDGQNVELTGNEVKNVGARAVQVAGDSDDITITDNTLTGSGWEQETAALRVRENPENVSVSENIFENNHTQIIDLSEELDLDEVLNNNTFDRAVVIRDSETDDIKEGFIFSYIQAAIDAAEEGDTIEVAAGTYEEAVTVDVVDGLTLKSAEGPEVTTIGNVSVDADDLIISGFELTRISGGSSADNMTIMNNRIIGSDDPSEHAFTSNHSADGKFTFYNNIIEHMLNVDNSSADYLFENNTIKGFLANVRPKENYTFEISSNEFIDGGGIAFGEGDGERIIENNNFLETSGIWILEGVTVSTSGNYWIEGIENMVSGDGEVEGDPVDEKIEGIGADWY